MADVIDFSDWRRKKQEEQAEKLSSELVTHCVAEISDAWERSARNNKLNDFFISSVPTWTRSELNYVNDLNALSSIESKIHLDVIVAAPATLDPEALGWAAGFTFMGDVVSTPEMVSEAYARAFNILLFLKLQRELKKINLHGDM